MIWILLVLLFIIPCLLMFNLVARDDNKIVIWPEYFDISLTKRKGRRVSHKLATKTPTVEEIAKAAKKLKLNPKIERNKTYPARWWRKTGRVLVRSADKKTKIIRRIAIIIKKSKK